MICRRSVVECCVLWWLLMYLLNNIKTVTYRRMTVASDITGPLGLRASDHNYPPSNMNYELQNVTIAPPHAPPPTLNRLRLWLWPAVYTSAFSFRESPDRFCRNFIWTVLETAKNSYFLIFVTISNSNIAGALTQESRTPLVNLRNDVTVVRIGPYWQWKLVVTISSLCYGLYVPGVDSQQW
jgi:hypothetical protein